MDKMLCIAEKPSVAMGIAKVLGANDKKDGYIQGDDYIVSWCVGHLIELAEPQEYDDKYSKWRKEDLPIIPFNDGEWIYKVSASTKKQYEILKELMSRDEVTSVCNCCDAGKEGELIFRLVYNQSGCTKAIKRLWISSMEDEAIMEGFDNLKDGIEYDALYKAALCRERADWILGINATRLFSCLYGQTLNVGRVMTPTLALVVEREAGIRAFKSEVFYKIILHCDGLDLKSDRISSEEEANELSSKCKAQSEMKITSLEKKEKRENPPALFDLTSLQRKANKQCGYTAQQTLDYLQSLYEKKLCTYPRTDSRYLTDDMGQTLEALLPDIKSVFDVSTVGEVKTSRVLNSKKVSDHHAILPTAQMAKYDLDSLPTGEKTLLEILSIRVAESVSEIAITSATEVVGEVCDTSFKATGKQVIVAGWKEIAGCIEEKEENETTIPNDISEGDIRSIHGCDLEKGKTTPPKSFTEDTLLSAMEKAGADETPDEAERKGLGTPATRAGIIEKLIRIGFLERRGEKKTKYLVPTHKGEALVTVVPEAIQSASMTAEWEQKLLQIEKRTFDDDEFMEEIAKLVSDLVDTYEIIPDAEVLMKPGYEVIGKCPCCGNDVVEKSKSFSCSNPDCKFALWKDNRFFDSLSKKLTKQIAEQMLSKGKAKLKKCRSIKTGKTYDCEVILTVNENNQAQFTLNFEKKGSK